MQHSKNKCRFLFLFTISLALFSCNDSGAGKEKDIVSDPETMDEQVAKNIKAALRAADDNDGKIGDSTKIEFVKVLTDYYRKSNYIPVWSKTENWQPIADSLYRFIADAEYEGLFPDDYHFQKLRELKTRLDSDSLSRMDAVLWTKADLLLTDGFMHIIKDLKQGRLQPDSISLNKDSVLADDFYTATLNDLIEKDQFSALLVSLQPKHNAYWELKKGIKSFVDSMDRNEYTHIVYPFKKGDVADSTFFIKLLQKRLLAHDSIDSGSFIDSVRLSKAIRKYQLKNGLPADGKYGKILVSSLNDNDIEKFKRIAVTLDRYKQLPEEMPEKYIWVNIPGYNLQLMQNDSLVFESKVICGKPETRTPVLTAEISDMITYPTWTVPNSIIVKQYLPKLKNNPDYISKIGLQLVNNKGEIIDPNTVTWSKYSRGIPYKVMQASGDNNSLGVIKFNFNNKYFVYLHDTNQRYLFKNSSRALSHGCVRVQEWEKLAYYIAANDSMLNPKKESLKYTSDSIRNWIAKKERHRVDVKNHIALYIRYFTCEGNNGKLKFYDDVYGEDRALIEKYFAKK